MLGFNFGNEYRALGGEVPLHELPSFQSMLRRTGLDASQEHVGALGWATFLRGQFGGIGGMVIPYTVVDRLGLDLMQRGGSIWPPPAVAPWLAVPGAAALAACAAGLRWLPQRTLFAALLLTGWCWAVPFRGEAAFHEFEAMFHLGVPLVLWALVLSGLHRLIGRRRAARALPAAALAAAAVFALSAAAMGRVGHGAAAAAAERETTADFGAMRLFAAGRTVLFEPALRRPAARTAYIWYWLYGSYPEPGPIGTAEEWAGASRRHDYVVAPVDLGGSLTPGNRRYHLYRPAALAAAWDAIAAREPDARSEFEVRLDGRTLTWTREDCAEHDVRPALFVRAVPLDAGDQPPDREYFLDYRGLRFGGRCIARIELPDYPLAGLRTGQRQGYLPSIWEVSLPVGDASFPRYASTWRETATAGEPAARGPFDVYRDGRTLTWVREDCAPEDAADRFFVHAYAADGGREAINFWFRARGVRYGGVCVATVELPDGDLRFVRTGQYDASGHLWDVGFAPDAEAWLARFASFAEREPAQRGPFDVHRDGRTLTYVREDCAAADTEDRFFVHAYASDPGDLPPERRASGFETLDFWFRDRGIRYGGDCMAQSALPDYRLRAVRTGQYDETGHLWDEEFALDAEAWLARFEAAAASEPALRAGGFGLRVDGRALTFAREACGAEDIADRFFVHVYAAVGGGRENLDFWFRERGLRHGDRCRGRRDLGGRARRRRRLAVAGRLAVDARRRYIAGRGRPRGRRRAEARATMAEAARATHRQRLASVTAPASEFAVVTERIEYATRHEREFVDVTDDVRDVVERSGVAFGQVLVSSAHTTAAVVVQEHEPLLLRDMARVLARFAPADDYYEHNDFTIRTNVPSDEPENGHAHCQHLLLGASETIPVHEGALQLGIWQSVFLVELDHPPQRPAGQQRRSIVVQAMGLTDAARPA